MALIPLMIWWYITRSSRQSSALLISSVNSFGETRSFKTVLRHVPFALRLMSLAFLISALARPQTRNDQEMVSGEGIDIILCMDVSGSMLAQDFTPNRLEAMKQVAADFVDKRPTDRIGLVIFAGESFTSSPITMDRATLKTQILNALNEHQSPRGRSEIPRITGRGLAWAARGRRASNDCRSGRCGADRARPDASWLGVDVR